MNKFKKWFKAFIALAFVGFAMSSCTANFCSNKDKAAMWYTEYGTVEGRNKLIEAAKETNDIPSNEFWVEFDVKTLEIATLEANARTNNKVKETLEHDGELDDQPLETQILAKFGYALYLDDNYAEASSNERELWKNFDKIVDDFNNVSLENAKKGPTTDFIRYYKNQLETLSSSYRTCITPEDGKFGGKTGIYDVEGKSWGYAWKYGGLFEGLFVYPISWGVHKMSVAFGSNGWGQLLAIVFITFIVRGLMMLFTFKSTIAQNKMTALQPELRKIQEKYPNADTNQYEKQRLAQAQMDLYKKNKVNPVTQLIVMIVQFPIFICVWGALQGAAILSTGDIFGLELSASLGKEMINFSSPNPGTYITAIVLFILMSVTQLISMKLPQWMQKKADKNVAKMGKNNAVDKNQSQMKMMNNVMLIMIIVMGISLPSAMGVYWLVSALISIIQTLITQKIIKRKKN